MCSTGLLFAGWTEINKNNSNTLLRHAAAYCRSGATARAHGRLTLAPSVLEVVEVVEVVVVPVQVKGLGARRDHLLLRPTAAQGVLSSRPALLPVAQVTERDVVLIVQATTFCPLTPASTTTLLALLIGLFGIRVPLVVFIVRLATTTAPPVSETEVWGTGCIFVLIGKGRRSALAQAPMRVGMLAGYACRACLRVLGPLRRRRTAPGCKRRAPSR